MQVIVTIRKEVETQDEANAFYAILKQKADEYPKVSIAGHTANHFAQEVTPE